MKLSREQFETLVCLKEKSYSPGFHAFEGELEFLREKGLVRDNEITEDGIKALEPYKAKRAIFFAAGFGSRMAPLTLTTPKPLIVVNGTRIIDTIIDACIKAEIAEIYIVRGYLAEKFDALKEKYPFIKFIENPVYNVTNHISSAYFSKELLSNTYILESDLVVSNPDIITKYHYSSDVLGIPVKHTDDWRFGVDGDGFVDGQFVGGDDCYKAVGVYYISGSDAERLKTDITKAYATEDGKQKYWDMVPNMDHRGEYKIKIRRCKASDIVEIDTVEELKALDASYR